MAFDMFNKATMQEFSESNDPGQNSTLIIKTPEEGEVTAVNGDIVLDDFSKFDILIETNKDNIQETDRLAEVTEMVLGMESISHSQVSGLLNQLATVTDKESIDKFKTSFEETVGPVGSFTSIPTKVNLAETKQFFTDQLGLSKKLIDDAYLKFIEEQQADFNGISDHVIFKLNGFIDAQEVYAITSAERVKRALSSKNFLVFVVTQDNEGKTDEKVMIDLRYVHISNRSLQAIQGNVLNLDLGQVEQLREVLCADYFQSVVSKVTKRDASTFYPDNCYYSSTLNFNCRDSEIHAESRYTYNYIDLLNLFSSGIIPAYFRNAILELQRNNTLVNSALAFFKNNGYNTELSFEGSDRKASFHDTVKMLNQLLTDITSIRSALTTITTAVKLFETVAPVFDQVLSGIKSEQA